jgi:putative nucleotidyltransferase with HDIG domain
MIHWDATTIIPIFATLIYGVVFIGVAFTKPRTKTRQVFSVYLLAMFVWSVSAFFTLSGFTDVQPWFNIFSAAAISSNLAIFYFVQTLFSRRRKWAPYIFWYGIVAVIITLIPDLVFHSVFLDESGRLHYEFAPLIGVVAGPGYFLMLFSLVELVRESLATTHETERNRLRYLVVGLSIIVLASLVNFTELGKYPIDIAANGVTAIIIAYAILRHQLLDIRVVLRIGLLYSIMTTVLGTFYYLVISLLINLSYYVLEGDVYSSGDIFLISVAVALMTGVVLTPVRNQAQTWIDRIFYREKYNAGLMLQRLSETTASLLDLTKITNLILDEVVQTLHIKHGAIYIKLYQYDDYRVMAQYGDNHNSYPGFMEDHPIVQWLSKTNQVLTKDNLEINPTFKSMWGLEREDLEEFGAELFIPLNVKGKLVGFLTVGPKLSSQSYSQDDKLILSTLANQTAVAVENALLYEELEDTFEQTVISLANAIDIRDTYTSDHSQHIAELAADTAKLLKCTAKEINDVYWGGLLHDIGKIGIPDDILNKPSGLSESDWVIIYQHTIIGAKIISPIKKLAQVAPIIEYSHENYDGSGYPHGAKSDEIPIGARVIRVVDSFSAMIDERPYKQARTAAEAIDEIKNNSGKIFDPQVVDAFLKVVELDGS